MKGEYMKVGFIGAGNMATAMIGGMLQKGLLQAEDIIASSATQKTADKVAEQFGIKTTLDNREVAKADIVILAIKPIYCEQVIKEIRDEIREDQIIVTIVAGRSLQWLADTFGKAEVVGEHLMDAVVAVSGSSPAYVFMFIEAMADAAVAEGMPRAQAYQFAAQSVLGSARMVLETGKHPGELKDMVCSPAGTTIAGVCKLEEKGFRSSVMECMKACAEKSRNM